MRTLLIITLAFLLSVPLFAQQAIWGGQGVVSPEIHEDNTVTFRYQAPKAVKVEITGDFLPTQKIETPYGQFDCPWYSLSERGTERVSGNIQPPNRCLLSYIAIPLLLMA